MSYRSFFVVPIFLLTSMFLQVDTETFEGTFDGKEDYGYNFIGIEEDGEAYTMTFHYIESSASKLFDLQSDAFIGKMFIVETTSYEIAILAQVRPVVISNWGTQLSPICVKNNPRETLYK